MSELMIARCGTEALTPGAAERAWLTRLCYSLARDWDDAEDLAQETLVEAWRHADKLTDPQGRRPWLAAIARNVCLRWRRQQAARLSHITRLDDPQRPDLVDLPDPATDPIAELDGSDRAELLDRALATVPAETRAALIGHYVEERSQRELAARLGINEAAVAARLSRGKAILRKALAGDLRDEARVFGWDASGWQETRIWCPICGVRRFQGQFDQDNHALRLRCPQCSVGQDFINHQTPIIAGVKTFKAALTRVMDWADTYYQNALATGYAACFACGRRATLTRNPDALASVPGAPQTAIAMRCVCQVQNHSDAAGLALFTGAGRQFLKRYERSRVIPAQDITYQGAPAFLVSFASLSEAARLDVAFDRATLQMLGANLSLAGG